LPREDAQIANPLLNLVSFFGLDEKTPQPVGRNFGRDGLGIDGQPRPLNARLAGVSSENLDRRLLCVPGEKLEKTHCDGVNFLAGGTGWRPDSHLLIGRAALEHLRKHDRLERVKYFRIAEEARNADEKVFL